MMTMHTTRIKKMEHFVIIFFIVVLTICVYWPVRHYDFVNFDDDEYVYNNEYVRKKISFENVIWAFSINNKNGSHWHPLTWLSHMMDCQLFGLSPGKHHLTNLCFHVVNSILLFLSLRLMSGSVWRSGFVALLFALHPVNVDSVAWIAQRKSVLSTFFWLLTMSAYAFYTRQPGFYRYVGVIILFLFGLMSKPVLLTLPFVLLLLDYWPLRRIKIIHTENCGTEKKQPRFDNRVLKLVLEKAPLFFLCFFLLFMSKMALHMTAKSFDLVSMHLRIENAIVSYSLYLGKMFWPFGLAVYYPYPDSVPVYEVFLSLCILIGVTYWAFIERERRPYFIIGWLWYIGTLFPAIGVIQVGLWPEIAERWAYIPFIGLFIIISWLIPDMFIHGKESGKIIPLLSGIFLLILIVLTGLQVRYWADSRTLWAHTLKVTTNNHVAHHNLGRAFYEKEMLDEAIQHYLMAIQIKPRFLDAYINLGNALVQKGKLNDAIAYYKKALAISPYSAKTLNNYGVALIYKGEIRQAVKYFRKALRINPDFFDAKENLNKVRALNSQENQIND